LVIDEEGLVNDPRNAFFILPWFPLLLAMADESNFDELLGFVSLRGAATDTLLDSL